jgi:hypothetical protein
LVYRLGPHLWLFKSSKWELYLPCKCKRLMVAKPTGMEWSTYRLSFPATYSREHKKHSHHCISGRGHSMLEDHTFR